MPSFKKIVLTGLAVFAAVVGVLNSPAVFAQSASSTIAPRTFSCSDGSAKCATIPNPLGGTDIFAQVGKVLQYVLLIIGSITLLMVVWGGFQWLTSMGNAEKVEAGSKTMMWAIIGVLAIFISYLLLGTYIDYLTGVK